MSRIALPRTLVGPTCPDLISISVLCYYAGAALRSDALLHVRRLICWSNTYEPFCEYKSGVVFHPSDVPLSCISGADHLETAHLECPIWRIRVLIILQWHISNVPFPAFTY